MMSLTDFDGGKISCWQWLICLWKFVSLTDSVTLDFGKLKQASRPSSSCCFVAHRTTWCEKKTLYNLEQGGKNIARKADVRCQDMEFETWNVNHIMWSIPIYQGIWWSRILFPRPLFFKILIWGFQGHNLFARVIWSLCWRSSSKHPLFTTLSPPQCRTYTHLNTPQHPQSGTYTHPNTLSPHSVGHTPTTTPSDTPLARTLLSMLANVITCVSIVLYIWSFCFVSKLTQQSL